MWKFSTQFSCYSYTSFHQTSCTLTDLSGCFVRNHQLYCSIQRQQRDIHRANLWVPLELSKLAVQQPRWTQQEGKESLPSFMCSRCHIVLPGFTDRGQSRQNTESTGDKKASRVLEFANRNGAKEVSDQVPHRTTYGKKQFMSRREITVEWLYVRCGTNRPAGDISRDCQGPSGVKISRQLEISDVSGQMSGALCANIFACKDTGCSCCRR